MYKKVFIKSWGCQMNDHDSIRVKDLLLQDGYTLTDKPEAADVLLFNTCSVRKHAEDRAFGQVASLKVLKEKRPGIIFGILGCMAEAHKKNIFKKLPHVDFICGPSDIGKIAYIIDRIKSGSYTVCLSGRRSKRFADYEPNKWLVGEHAYVKIMEGCDNFCSYCVVPYVRGAERSRPQESILKEVDSLLQKGAKTITLLGQNVNSYGKNLKESITFPELLKNIDTLVIGRAAIYFLTSHPKDANVELFKVIADSKSISRKLHLPLQSGSDKILKRMNRRYTIEKYKNLVKQFRHIVKHSEVSTDIIVGFPGETEKDFLDTLKALREIKFDSAYIFKYSPRPFTKAAKNLNDNVPKEEKERRHALLLESQKSISLKKRCQ